MSEIKIKAIESGVAIILPYEDNANYSKSEHGLGISHNYALDVVGDWSKYLQKILRDNLNKMKETLAANLENCSLVTKNLIVFSNGKRIPLGTYGSHVNAIKALEEGNYSKFLCCYVQITRNALIQVREPNPEKQSAFTLEQLNDVLNAADHDCID